MMLLKAFLIGGLICLIGQLIMDLTPYKITPAHILVGYVCGGAILSSVGAYGALVKFAGAGASIPLSGFGHSLAQGVAKGIASKGILGAFSGGIEATSAGIAAAVVFGYVMAVLFRPSGVQ
ncbi:MAG: stage V sporulation protein AE [Clostridia bacterium]|nr:stage V sporulation protein AE [Clostridia bacterium]